MKGLFNKLVPRKNKLSIALLSALSFLCVSAHGEGGAGGALNGAAAIISATSPMVVAGINAAADTAVKGIQAGVTRDLASMQAQLTQYTTALAAQTATSLSYITRDIAFYKEESATTRLLDSLRAVAYNNDENRKMERLKLAYQMDLQREILRAGERKFAVQMELDRLTNYAREVAAGLSRGSIRVDRPLTAGLTLTPVTGPATAAANAAFTPPPKPFKPLWAMRGSKLASIAGGLNRYLGGNVVSGSTPERHHRVSSDLALFQSAASERASRSINSRPRFGNMAGSERARASEPMISGGHQTHD